MEETNNMKKLVTLKPNQLQVIRTKSIYCDFCGENNVDVFESTYDEGPDPRKCVMQICDNCVKQLAKLIEKATK